MKLQDNYEEIIAEQLAQSYLSRTGLVIVQRVLGNADLIASSKGKEQETIYVEVKATNAEETSIPNKFHELIRDLKAVSNQKPHIVFFINIQQKTGYFQIFSQKNQSKLHELRMDLLSSELSLYFSVVGGMEFPPYIFYQRDGESKYTTREIPVDQKFAILRLYNLTFNKMDYIDNFKLYITIQENGKQKQNPKPYPFNERFYNPRLKDFLFFVNKSTGAEYTDIRLPADRKSITFNIESTENVDFEIKLACEYIVER